jgi:hypothetical protein
MPDNNVFDTARGTLAIGRRIGDPDTAAPATLRLWSPAGATACHTQIIHGAGRGGTNLLDLIACDTQDTPLVECWMFADGDLDRRDALRPWWEGIDRAISSRAAELAGGPWTGPTEDMPLLLILVDGDGIYPVDDVAANSAVRQIITRGGAVGVALVLASHTDQSLPADLRNTVHSRLRFVPDGPAGRAQFTWLITPDLRELQHDQVQVRFCPSTPVRATDDQPGGVMYAHEHPMPTWPPRRASMARRVAQTLGISRRNLPGALRLVVYALGKSAAMLLTLAGFAALTLTTAWLAFPDAVNFVVGQFATADVRHAALAAVIALATLALICGITDTVVETADRRARRRRDDWHTKHRAAALSDLRGVARDLRRIADDLRRRTGKPPTL